MSHHTTTKIGNIKVSVSWNIPSEELRDFLPGFCIGVSQHEEILFGVEEQHEEIFSEKYQRVKKKNWSDLKFEYLRDKKSNVEINVTPA